MDEIYTMQKQRLMELINMPADGCANDISCAADVPLPELLRRVPKGMRLSMKMEYNEQTAGYFHTPIGHHCHDAAHELDTLRDEVKIYQHCIDRAIKELRAMVDGGKRDRETIQIIDILERQP